MNEVTLRNIQGEPFVSERGAELFCDGVCDKPVLTVENYMKWYTLYVIFPSGHVEALYDDDVRSQQVAAAEAEFDRHEPESAYGDHVFNPRFVKLLAERLDMDLCGSAFEAIVGRWEIEYKHRYEE